LKLENYWNCVFLNQQKIYEQMLAGANAATITANLQNVALVEKLAEQEIHKKNLEKQLVKTTEEFSQLKSIMANTAHDFKSPLNTLILGKTNHSPLNYVTIPTCNFAAICHLKLE
jgi:signal transduction histidine kinase